MAEISEHNPEHQQKIDGEHKGRLDFLVAGHPKTLHQHLKWPQKVGQFAVGGNLAALNFLLRGGARFHHTGAIRDLIHRVVQILKLAFGAPAVDNDRGPGGAVILCGPADL
ncbi:MAG: hypothetical protein R6V56_05230 [Lentisphaeria bacterium]